MRIQQLRSPAGESYLCALMPSRPLFHPVSEAEEPNALDRILFKKLLAFAPHAPVLHVHGHVPSSSLSFFPLRTDNHERVLLIVSPPMSLLHPVLTNMPITSAC